ncbi:hypothetical protein NLG97_g2845 [Lecanicillium saksenae]|uniref:Uncharacterized protein n=1 Tax=Lecanicillium saksenae TaxID=468837 RepID=A0ACC1R1M1_9HYPO|nr:hypothetical protein NLG97_g2845 [Lecanicillium saksenae]
MARLDRIHDDDKEEQVVTVSLEPLSPISDDEVTLSGNDSSDPEHTEEPAPDGGRRAWLVVLGGFLNFTASFGIVNAFGTFESAYQTKLGMSTSLVSWIGSIQMFVLFLGGIVVGPAYDRWGARLLMLLGTFLCLLSFVACSFSTQFYQLLLAQGFLLGVGCALLFYPTTSAVSEWFDKKRGLALGLVIAGASSGGILWPLVLNQLIDKIGIYGTHRASGIIAAPLLFVACFLVKERRQRQVGPGQGATAADSYKDGDSSSGSSKKEAAIPQPKMSLFSILDPRFLATSVALLFINGGMMVPFFYIPQYAIDHGVSATMANNMLAITYVASLTGRILSGWIADYVGRFNMLLTVTTITGIATVSWSAMSTLPGIMAVSILFGFASGGIVPLGSACIAQLTPPHMMRHMGLRIGTMMTICSAGMLVGGPLSGTIKDKTQQWAGVYLFTGGEILLGLGILFAVRMVAKRRVLVF